MSFINALNAQWLTAAARCSPRVLGDLFAWASGDLADWVERLPLDAPALFGVSWAGEQTSDGWFDIGREFTELWHHQQQVRMAVDAPSLADARYLGAVIEIAGEPAAPTTRARLSDDAAWKLLFNALPDHDAVTVVQVEGEPALAAPLLKARSVVV